MCKLLYFLFKLNNNMIIFLFYREDLDQVLGFRVALDQVLGFREALDQVLGFRETLDQAPDQFLGFWEALDQILVFLQAWSRVLPRISNDTYTPEIKSLIFREKNIKKGDIFPQYLIKKEKKIGVCITFRDIIIYSRQH